MVKVLIWLAMLAVVLFAGFNVSLSRWCNSDWCLFFPWQRIAAVKNFDDCARLDFPVQESSPRQCRAGDKTYIESSNSLTESDNIKVSSPQPGEEVTSPVTIAGSARVFESVVSYRIRNSDGTIIASGTTITAASDVGLFGPFSVEVSFTAPTTGSGTVEVYQASARDGSDTDKVTIPILFR